MAKIITVQRGYFRIIKHDLSVDFGAVLVLLELFGIYSGYEWELLLYLHFFLITSVLPLDSECQAVDVINLLFKAKLILLIGDFWYLPVS
jgi:hypothetical protein